MAFVASILLLLIICSQSNAQEASPLDHEEGEMLRDPRSLDMSKIFMKMLEPLQRMVTCVDNHKPIKPYIKGPKSRTDRIAIVGGGIAGLHMAYLLNKKGFKNVVVLEKSARVGGKIMSVDYEGVKHEMGACYCTPDYEDNVYELAAELGISEEEDMVPVPSSKSVMWLDEVPGPMSFTQFVIWDIMQQTGAKTKLEAMYLLVKHSVKYIITHLKLFGLYPGDIMPRPSDTVFSKYLNTSFWEFLSANDMKAMHPMLVFSHALQGYGYLDEVSTIYGLMWNSPKLVLSSVVGALTKQFPIKIYKKGFQQIPDRLNKLVRVYKNISIDKILRRTNDLIIRLKTNGRTFVKTFDFLIWAADSREALKVLSYPTPQEKKFNRLNPSWFTTTLVRAHDKCESNVTIKRWLSSLFRKEEYSLMAFRDSKGCILGRECPAPHADISGVTYQYGTKSPLESGIVDKKFNEHFDALGIEDREVIKRQIWNYFPHYGVQDMADGILWDLIEKQGTKNTWFIGGSVCHESVKSIVNYNKMLIKGMY